MTLLLIACLMALVISVDALRRTITAWSAVMERRARTEDIQHLTGFANEREVLWNFSQFKKDDYFDVSIRDIFKRQTKTGRVYGDPIFDVMIAVMISLSILSQSVPLMMSATLFVLLWHVIGRNTAPALERGDYDYPSDE